MDYISDGRKDEIMPDEEVHPIQLSIRARTPHGEPIAGAKISIHSGDEIRIAAEDGDVYRITLPRPGDYHLVAERAFQPGGFDHRTLRATLFYIPTPQGPVLRPLAPPEHQRARIDTIEARDGLFEVRLTLDYLWFTHIGYPPTLGNRIQLLVDGEDGWGAVAKDLKSARRSAHLTTWMYQPNIELTRPEPLAEPEERRSHTVHALLQNRAEAGVNVRLLLWDWPLLRQRKEARRAGRQADDNFEVMEQANPAEVTLLPDGDSNLFNKLLGDLQLGTYHQKTVMVDGAVGFCGGMNLNEGDWDTRQHRLFDPRRCKHKRDSRRRQQVEARREQPDYPPRHDYVARVEGPVVQHLELNFQERWHHLLEEGVRWSQNATPMADPPRPEAFDDGCQVQVVRTMPEPFSERGILDIHLRAIEAARRLIYIEDQYFRSTYISDAVAAAVRRWPKLHLVVLTIQSQADHWLFGGWSREAFERIHRRKPDFELYTLKVSGEDDRGERHLEEVFNHAKLMIVDDLFLTVGSANINDRSFEYEGDINLAVADSEWAKAARLDIWNEHLNGDSRLTGDIDGDVAVWMEHAADNRRFLDGEVDRPRSNVFPFEPRSDRKILTEPGVVSVDVLEE